MYLFFIILTIYMLGILLSPFPYWHTYLLLWKTILFSSSTWRTKSKQAFFLIKAVIYAPITTFFWYLDEILYSSYRKRNIKPVFIIGQPRCGTTFLHRTIAADDDNFFAVRHIEWRYPFISIQKLFCLLGIDRYLQNINYWKDSEAGKLAAKMHPNTLADWEEDGIFFEENFLHHFFIFLRFPHPELLPHLDSFSELPKHVQQKMLNTYRKVLQKVHYLRGVKPRLFISKEVTSHKKIPALIQMFPDARFVVIVRPASHFMPSLMALVRMSTMSKTGVDPLTLPQWQEAFISRMRDDSNLLVSLCKSTISTSDLIMVSSEDFTSNPKIAVVSIYRALKLSLPEKYLTCLERIQVKQKTRQRGYDYEALMLEGFEKYDDFVQEVATHYKKNLSLSNQPVLLHTHHGNHDQISMLIKRHNALVKASNKIV